MRLTDIWTGLAGGEPLLALAAALTLGTAFVNGWTDAPNAIAAAVSSGALPFRRAARLAAGGCAAGFLLSLCLRAGVARTVYELVLFPSSPRAALAALCAALGAVVLWGTLGWLWGLPTSESHALMAALAGAAVALGGGPGVLDPGAWGKVLAGLLLSAGAGFWLARLVWVLLPAPREQEGRYRRLQTAAAALTAALHGAQDGQKFLGVLLLALSLSAGGGGAPPVWAALACAGAMGLGVRLGGRRIVRTVGERLVRVDLRQGAAADLAGIGCLALSTALGLPVSTTHTKTAALWGAGTAGGKAHRGTLIRLWLAWGLTFPCCALLGWLLARLAAGTL